MLKALFNYIDKGNKKKDIPKYNGDLFKPDPLLDELEISDELLLLLKDLWVYDFADDISETILGHIFEQSIADLDQIYETVDEENELQLQAQTKGTSGKRKKDGVVYTPDFITAWIVEQTLGIYLQNQQAKIEYDADSLQWWQTYRDILATTRICDPACGSGAFLVAAFHFLKREITRINRKLEELGNKGDLFSTDLNDDILNNNLFGVDLNAESVEIARLSLWLATAEQGKPLTSLKDNIRQGNSVINHKNAAKNAFRWEGKFSEFDVVLGNPPYVRQELLSDIKPYLEKYYSTYHGVADLYTYFFELGLKILKNGGYMGFISSSTFFRTGSGESLRRFLQLDSNLKTVVNFGDLQVFEGVTTYPAILVMEKPVTNKKRKNPPRDHYFRFLNIASAKVTEVSTELQEADFGKMKQAKLTLDGWRLEDEDLQALRTKILANKKTLKEVYGQPLYGLKTGLNAAFVIDQETRNQIIQQNPSSSAFLKPFLEGKDLKKWRAESRHLYLILFKKGWTRQQMGKSVDDELTEQEAWQWLQQQHPAICTWLEPFTERGRKRGDKGEFWWELRACIYYNSFEKPKIVYNRFMPKPLFWLDTQKKYFNNALNLIADVTAFELGILNSNISWFCLSHMGSAMSGGFFQIHGHVLERLPIPKSKTKSRIDISELATNCQSLAEKRYKQQDTLRHRIPDLCPPEREAKLSNKLKNWWELDFSDFQKGIKSKFKYSMTLSESMDWQEVFDSKKEQIETLSLQLANKESELNQEVYKLFKLTDEEITLLEKSIAK